MNPAAGSGHPPAALQAVVALGSNTGDSPRLIREAFDRLRCLGRGAFLTSSLWRSTPVECPPGSPLFVNAVAAFEPLDGETPEHLLHELQALERESGRRPKRQLNEPRPLDLDLITFGGHLRRSPDLILPHPRAHERRFVLLPLAEILPDLILPGQPRTARELLAALRGADQVELLG